MKTILRLQEENYSVEDLQAENISFIENNDDVEQFNKDYDCDYNFYYILWIDDNADMLFGSYNCFLNNMAYFVAKL